MATMAGAQTLANPSDNGLLDGFLDPALGCKPWTAPNLTNPGAMSLALALALALALNELQADARQKAPVALVPLNNPMTLVNGQMSNQKTNLYRAGVDQPAVPTGQTPAAHCRQMDTIQAARLQKDQ